MKLQVTQENLSKALSNVAKIANSRNTLPILSNVIIKTIGTRLSLAATNLEIAITCYVGSKVNKEGAITVPARLMQDFVSSLPSGVINLSLDDYKLHISTDKYESTINGVSAEEFPVMPTVSKGEKWTVNTSVFKNSLSQVIVAASTDEARPILTGVFLHSYEGKLFAVATDSYRLAEKEIGPIDREIKLLIPATALQELLRVISEYDEDLTITHDDQQVSFTAGDIELVTRLLEGNFPDYRKLLPQKFSTKTTLKRADFANITKVSSLFARESAGSITISASESDKQVSIRSVASQVGENTATADAKVRGEGEITLNSRYLADALNVISSEDISFSFNGKLEPCILRQAGAKDYTHVVMPLKS